MRTESELQIGGVAHSVERSVRNRQAQGSKPCSSTFFFSKAGFVLEVCGVTKMVP